MKTSSDVEYLKAPWPFDRHLVYVYRTGALRGQVKAELRTAALRRGEELYTCSPGELLAVSQGATLFSGTHLCDWSEADTTRVGVDAVLSALASEDGERIAFFIKHGDALLDNPIWPSVRNNNCVFVEEQIVTVHNFEVTLAYLQNQSDIPYAKNLASQEAFAGYFFELIEINRAFALPDFMQEFDKAVLLYTDPASGVFDEKTVLKKHNERNAIVSSLREFIRTRETLALVRVIRAIEQQRRQGRGHLRLIAELCRSTLRILDQQAPDRSNPASGAASADALDGQLIQWIAILLSWIDRLRTLEPADSDDKPGGDLLLVCIDQMAREYSDQFESEIPSGPPSGAWSHLRDVLANVDVSLDELGTVQARLVQEFARYLGAGGTGEDLWIERLRATVNADMTAECQNAGKSIVSERAPYAGSPLSFADLVGHDVAVRSLQTRLRTERWGAPIILHGPAGVGKRTLARLYAKALTCEGATEGAPAPCGRCSACAQFEKGGGFGLVELDATASSAAAEVGAQLKNLRFAPFARHRVVIIRNLDRAPVIADAFLKTLERNDAMTTFVITLRDVEALSPAARSRCAIYKLKALSPPLGRRLCAAFLRTLNYEQPDAAELYDLIAAGGGGLPGRIEELCRKIAAIGPTTIGDARKALDLDWASDALSDFRSLLSDGSNPQGWTTADSKSRARKFRLLLEHLYRIDDQTRAAEPSLWHIDAAVFREPLSLIATSAARQRLDPSDVLAELAGVWLEDDYSDAQGFLGAVQRSRQIISGRRWKS